MPELVVLVTDQCSCIDDILKAWLECGVSGATILDSRGMGKVIVGSGAPDDLPLIPSLSSMMRQDEETQRTLFSVVPDGFDVAALVAATERITGPLDQPHTGIMFAMPVTRTWGLKRMNQPG
jgi:nitrogen regulatory protein P-II 1